MQRRKLETKVYCLAASGGGHVRQLNDLEPLWGKLDYFFVTEDTALGRSLAQKHPTEFVEHVALGQARLGAPFKMTVSAIRNAIQSLGIIVRRRPDVVITTGAGAMFFVMIWAKLFRAQIILIDSFARFDAPSTFARIGGPLADIRIAQSAKSAAKWKNALTFDSFRVVDCPRPPKEPLLFATVGATLPFARLTGLVSRAKISGMISERVVLQTGVGVSSIEGMDCYETLTFEDVKHTLSRADIVVCHGGTGSIITALQNCCRVIAVPRKFELGEHYDNHQSEITAALEKRGLIAVANTDEDFGVALERVKNMPPHYATIDPTELIEFLRYELKIR
jgi:UDP-N-acetylglucosamine--N-acetylmuramyl-(pentapeptide) pyrophosphoryl-undecaprenol N-acetylglucosamine transferase